MKRKILRVLFALVLVFGIGLVIAPTSPGELEISNLSIQPAEVQPNETVTITVTVYNGGYDGDYYVVLMINGEEEATETLENFAGNKDITFKVTREEPGNYNVNISVVGQSGEGVNGSFTVIGPSPTITPAEFSVSNLGIQPAEVQPNETVTITVSVANTGGNEGSHTVVLKINGEKEAEKGVTVAAGSSQDVTFTVTREEPGNYSVTVGGLSGSFTVIGPSPTITPAEFSVSNLGIQPAEVQPNETVTITVSVANTGGSEGSYTVVLMINGEKEAEKGVTVVAGNSQDVTFSVTREEAASYSVTVAGLSGSFTVVAPAPPGFSVSNLGIQPAEVQPNETVTITVSVANTGGNEGSHTVVLKINGEKEAEKGVTVAAGSSQDVTFSVTREEAGSYSVTVAGLSGSFTLVAPAPTPSINWAIVAGIIAAVVAVGLLTFFLIRRRAT